ncbi:hypothetical protein NE670_01460 [Flavonifractor plautii]|uniref:hypothetical protein n=1 Tax=Flavonifractor plautii TaxID=292800 RepID=UPI00210AC8F2|nr:hypothetical protein [Flavonifractor plautii]MCQ4783949.1 hypothetical protein [Flavonifractor plautii]
MRDKAVAMLTALGVAGAADDPLLDIALNNVQYRVQNETNRKDMPEGLVSVAVYMAVGEYLNMKKVSGQLEGFDLEAAIKQIQEGDTNTVFAIGDGNLTPEQRLNSLIDYLTNGRSRELYRFRKFVW